MKRGLAYFPAGLVNRGQWHRQQGRIVHIVYTDQPNILRDAHSLSHEGMHKVPGDAVISADEGITFVAAVDYFENIQSPRQIRASRGRPLPWLPFMRPLSAMGN